MAIQSYHPLSCVISNQRPLATVIVSVEGYKVAVNGNSCSPLNSRVESHACFIFCNNFTAHEKDIRGCTRLRDMHGRGSRWATNENFSAICAISCRYLELGREGVE